MFSAHAEPLIKFNNINTLFSITFAYSLKLVYLKMSFLLNNNFFVLSEKTCLRFLLRRPLSSAAQVKTYHVLYRSITKKLCLRCALIFLEIGPTTNLRVFLYLFLRLLRHHPRAISHKNKTRKTRICCSI